MSIAPKILVCDDDETLCYLLKEQLIEEGYTVDIVYDGSFAMESINKRNYDILLLDLNMTNIQGEEVLKYASENQPTLKVIVLTAQNELRKAIECIKLGAFDFINKPYIFEELLITIERALEHKDLVIKAKILETKIEQTFSTKIIGESKAIKDILALANKSAMSDSNVLVEGETGTGKELFAEYIHQNSERKDKPFVIINCASLPDQLIESELFGHEKGAFTDAKNAKQGLVEIANGGTLFLDEIGELSLTLQPKLLRFLENGEYRRIGGVNTLNSNVRVIGATNRDLFEESEAKKFRRDLLFRLNVITLTIPPLRQRKEDIMLLANYFLKTKSIKNPKTISLDAENYLLNYDYPGNVRELHHIIERSIIFADDNTIKAKDLMLPQVMRKDSSFNGTSENNEITTLDDVEREYMLKALKHFNWDRTITANKLGISLKTLYTKIKKYDLK